MASFAIGGIQSTALTQRDKSFLIKDALEHELNGQGASEPDIVVYFSTRRIGTEFLPGLGSDRLVLLSPDEIKKKDFSREEIRLFTVL